MLHWIPAIMKYDEAHIRRNLVNLAMYISLPIIQACDTYDNVNEVIFRQMAQAAAYTLSVSHD